jgi:O-acetyl-ADP-ribose deacetylase (regulator of RNase III)
MLTSQGFNVLSDEEAILILSQSPGRFVLYIGAGASVEVGVPTAAGICEELADELLRIEEGQRIFKGVATSGLTGTEREQFLRDRLDWDDDENRYYNCLTRILRSPANRVDYFRKKLEHVEPAFAHYASAFLMTRDHLARTAITTNFDKLLENAFSAIGKSECQAIRMSEEVRFWRQIRDKCYLLKLHGDYDTHNLLNTEEETVILDEEMVAKAQNVLENAGLLVLGSAGREKSIHTFMDNLASDRSKDRGILEHGLLWGVYVGAGHAGRLRNDEIIQLVQDQIAKGVVGTDIVRLMKRRAKDHASFAFFPVTGCGAFLWNLLRQIEEDSLVAEVEQYLDHGLRIGEIFRRKGLSEAARQRHIQSLDAAQAKLKAPGGSSSQHEYVLEAKTADDTTRIWLAYGDIADERLLEEKNLGTGIKALVSPEDTCLSIGGGAALAIAQRAGLRHVLHDLYKFAPIVQGATAVTSAGRLSVHYLIHAASVDVAENGASTTQAAVKTTMENVLKQVHSLDIRAVWVPLLGAGVAGMSPMQSAAALLDAINAWLPSGHDCTIVITVFKESMFPRYEMVNLLRKTLTNKTITIKNL